MTPEADSDDGQIAEIHAINVTPFIDVILVLLIIFMVAAPLSTVQTDVDLPASNASARTPPVKPVMVTLAPDLSVRVAGALVARSALPEALAAATQGRREQRIYIQADRRVSYGDLMTLMNDLRTAGYDRIALVGLSSPDARALP